MENVVLVVHLILALCLIGIVLLQRSEGGGLGMGGGGGGGGVMSGRAAATALAKLTWVFAIAFIITSISLTIIAARNAADQSVLDRTTDTTPAETTAPVPAAPSVPVLPESDLLPPSPADATNGGPVAPPRAD